MTIDILRALSDNIKINVDKCTFCGVCVNTCILDNLRMKKAPCRQSCPLDVNCQGYVQLILRGEDEASMEMLERKLAFPSILSRVCSAQCETTCHLGVETGSPVAIRELKRFVSDRVTQKKMPECLPATGKRCAIVGAGPAGLMAAYDLALNGHQVNLIDSNSAPGGMLRWAIPEFRLPSSVIEEEYRVLDQMGVNFKGNTVLGTDVTIEELENSYDAVILAIGCSQPKKLNLPGSDTEGVIYALPFLRDVRKGERPKIGKRVVVIGGGDVAVDAAQTALRLSATSVTVVKLEEDDAMLASPEIIEAATGEGVEIMTGSWGPYRIAEKDGKVSALEVQRCLSMFDSTGKFAPEYDQCTLHNLEADTIIIAIGQESEKQVKGEQCDKMTLQLPDKNRFVAGDLATGPRTVVEAMATGRQAAESVHRLFTNQHMKYGRSYPGPYETDFHIDTTRSNGKKRVQPAIMPFKGIGDFTEKVQPYTEEEARKEAGRCYSCGKPFGKYRTCWFCLPCEVECPNDALWVEIPYLLR